MTGAPPAQPIGVYIHVPFCIRKCPYCDFYSVPFTDPLADDYTDAAVRTIRTHPWGSLQADTLYFGGGTPVLLGQNRLRRIISAARHAFGMEEAAAEVTVEANPAAAMEKELAALREAGCNRISFGVQSLVDAELSALGRLHNAETAVQAILAAKQAGFDNISADLMLAIPGQTAESLAGSIDRLARLPVNHISAYLLKVEQGTDFFSRAQAGALSLPDEDAAAKLYLDCITHLEQHGFLQYEISNFARDGNVSRHNLKYWQCKPYLGIGPAAHSFLGGRRFYFPRDLDGFCQAEQPFSLAQRDGAGGGVEERLLLGLRLNEGVTLDALDLSQASAQRILEKARLFEQHGLTVVPDSRIALTPAGFLLSNSVITALLDCL